MRQAQSQKHLIEFTPSQSLHQLHQPNENHLKMRDVPRLRNQKGKRIVYQLKDQICILTSFQRYQLKSLWKEQPLLKVPHTESFGRIHDNHFVQGQEMQMKNRSKFISSPKEITKRSLIFKQDKFPTLNFIDCAKSMKNNCDDVKSQFPDWNNSQINSPLFQNEEDVVTNAQINDASRQVQTTQSKSRNYLSNAGKHTVVLSNVHLDIQLHPQTSQNKRCIQFQLDPNWQAKLKKNKTPSFNSHIDMNFSNSREIRTKKQKEIKNSQISPFERYLQENIQSKFMRKNSQTWGQNQGTVSNRSPINRMINTKFKKNSNVNIQSQSNLNLKRKSESLEKKVKPELPKPKQQSLESSPMRNLNIFQNRYYSNNFVENAGLATNKNAILEKRFLLTDLMNDLKDAIYNPITKVDSKALENIKLHNEQWIKILKMPKDRYKSPRITSLEKIDTRQLHSKKNTIQVVEDHAKLEYNE